MWFKLFISVLLVHYSSAICDVCLSGKTACHSKNTYSICINDIPTRDIITCPEGYTCTGEKYICYPENKGYKPVCIPTDDIPTIATSSTPKITTTPTITTTTSSQTFCEQNDDGYYVNNADPTCKTYLRCYRGREKRFDCQPINNKETYFNGVVCAVEKPDNCT